MSFKYHGNEINVRTGSKELLSYLFVLRSICLGTFSIIITKVVMLVFFFLSRNNTDSSLSFAYYSNCMFYFLQVIKTLLN